MTLEEARAELRSMLDEGTTCPCCDQFAKRYRRKLHSGMAHALCWMVRVVRGDRFRWLDVPREAQREVITSNEHGKLQHWGLVEQRPKDDADPSGARYSGVWRAPAAGGEFAEGRVAVASHAYIYDNRPDEFSSTVVSIQDALGDYFDYYELMGYPHPSHNNHERKLF